MFSKFISKKKIELYVDRENIIDNAYYQFKNDFLKKDSYKRYYIYSGNFENIKEYFTDSEKLSLIKFGSIQHIWFLLNCERIYTSFADREFYNPLKLKNFNTFYAHINDPQIVYLQHGVMHAKTLHYSREYLKIDKIVVSTDFEMNNLLNNSFYEYEIINTGMARFDSYNKMKKPKNKILYIPSWRKYLVGSFNQRYNRFDPLNLDKIKNEEFIIGIKNILTSRKICEILTTYKYNLDIKLHPILQDCKYNFFKQTSNPNISIINKIKAPEDYSIIITDISSYIYDFVYLNRICIIYIPDIKKLDAGMNLYSDFYIDIKNTFHSYCTTIHELELSLDYHINNKTNKSYNNFFLNYNNHSQKLYDIIHKEEYNEY